MLCMASEQNSDSQNGLCRINVYIQFPALMKQQKNYIAINYSECLNQINLQKKKKKHQKNWHLTKP